MVFLSLGRFILSAPHFVDDAPLVSDDEFLQAAIEPAEVGFAILWPSRWRFDRRQDAGQRFNHDRAQHRVCAAVRFVNRPDARNYLFQPIAKRRVVEDENSNGGRQRWKCGEVAFSAPLLPCWPVRAIALRSRHFEMREHLGG
jgi:hypothetical protein